MKGQRQNCPNPMKDINLDSKRHTKPKDLKKEEKKSTSSHMVKQKQKQNLYRVYEILTADYFTNKNMEDKRK